MKAFMIHKGDLVVSGGRLANVTGTSKIRQDVSLALGEEMGNDRFHPGWGSELRSRLASVVSDGTVFEIEAEVRRVLGNYSAVQRDQIEGDIYSGVDTSRYTTGEILGEIVDIAVDQRVDSVHINIRLKAQSGEIVVMNRVVY